MSASVKTSGIVLKGTNFGEADKILTVFTERFGKIKVIAKGVRKIKSHLAGALEPFMLVDLQLHQGKTFFIATGGVIIKEFANLHGDLSKIAKAFFLGEMTDRFLEEDQENTEIFQLFLSALDEIDKSLPGPLIQAFQLKIVEAAGFMPELYECVHCKEKLTLGDNFWDMAEGGVICESCNQKTGHGKQLSDETIKLFRFITQNNFAAISRLRIASEIDIEAGEILSNYVESILERELKSQRFLKML
ncbi:MAG: DNA repair protein RecO [Patescibacteria group bacterium]